MTMGEWADYFASSDRPRVLNVLSLELTGTRSHTMFSSLTFHSADMFNVLLAFAF